MSDLKNSIRLGMMIGELNKADQNIHDYVKQFLASKFLEASIKISTEGELKILSDLWFEITGEKYNEQK